MSEQKRPRIYINDFSSGVNSFIDQTKLKDNEFPVFENAAVNPYGNHGSFVKRNGYTEVSSNQIDGAHGILSLFEARFSNGNKYLIGNSAHSTASVLKTLLYDNTVGYQNAWSSSLATGIPYNNKLYYTMLRNKVYLSNIGNGANPNYVWNETNYLEIGCPPCINSQTTINPAAQGRDGELGSGAYFYLVVFVYDYIQESGVIAYAKTGVQTVNYFDVLEPYVSTVTNDSVLINLPISPNARCTSRKIYRSKAEANVRIPPSFMYELTTINDNSTTTYLDKTPDTELGTAIRPIQLYSLNKPYISKYVTNHKNRLVQGYLTENLYTQLNAGDFTFTPTAGGNLTQGFTYTYRLRKIYPVNNNGFLEYKVGPVTEIQPEQLSGLNNSYSISYSGSDAWANNIQIQRNSQTNPSEFKYPQGGTNRWKNFGYGWAFSEFPVSDTTGDNGLVDIKIKLIESVTNETVYPSGVSFSESGKPDVVPAGNVINVEQTDGDPITGIFSEEDRLIIFKHKSIHYIDTRFTDSNNWRANKLYEGIGADDAIQVKGGYFFRLNKTVQGLGSLDMFYLWDGVRTPQHAGDLIINYVKDNSMTLFKDMIYDHSNELIQIIMCNGINKTWLLKYSIETGKWFVDTNDTDLSLTTIVSTKDKGVLFGNGSGHLIMYDETKWQDKINGVNRDYTAAIQTKTFIIPDKDIRPYLLAANIIKGSNFTGLTLIYSVDGLMEAVDNTTMVSPGSGFARLKSRLFTGANDKSYRELYFRLTEQSNSSFRLLSIALEHSEEHESGMGRNDNTV